MINVRGTGLWFNFRHDRQTPPNLPVEPVTRSELALALARVTNTQLDKGKLFRANDDAFKLLERYEAEHDRVSHITTCRVFMDDAGTALPLFETTAKCSRFDNFCRRTGRWYTLARAIDALRDFNVSEDLVERFLSSYFGRYDSGGPLVAKNWALSRGYDERIAYTKWLRADYGMHKPATVRPVMGLPVCPVCDREVSDADAFTIAETGGHVNPMVFLPKTYHRTCYLKTHPPTPRATKDEERRKTAVTAYNEAVAKEEQRQAMRR